MSHKNASSNRSHRIREGKVSVVIALFINCSHKQAHNFCDYLTGLSTISIFLQEGLCSIGSGAVESAVKQLGRRLKISGAQWQLKNVHRMVQLRCAYVNGSLAVWCSCKSEMLPTTCNYWTFFASYRVLLFDKVFIITTSNFFRKQQRSRQKNVYAKKFKK